MGTAMFEIRAAEPGDIDALRDVFRRSSLSNVGDRANLLANPEFLEFSDASLLEGHTRVAVASERVVGFATTVDTDRGLELEDLFVDPDWMRRGVGRELVADVLDTARARGIPRIDVIANPHALAFYEGVGFVGDDQVETRFGTGVRMHREV